jgi:hypothetical protein
VNPGGHGIFDFLRRDPATYLPDLALTRFERSSPFLPPRAVNLRGGVPFWDVLAAHGIASTILRCPCTFPHARAFALRHGVPDLRGGLGTSILLTTTEPRRDGEQVDARVRDRRISRPSVGRAIAPGTSSRSRCASIAQGRDPESGSPA